MRTTRHVLFLIGLLAVFVLACSLVDRMLGQAADSNKAVLLNEVLFQPADGQQAFVEFKIRADRTSLAGMLLKNEQGEAYSIPENIPSFNSDQLVLVIFDGTDGFENGTIHADRTGFVNPESGLLELYAPGDILLDRVAWGVERGGSVRLSRGGMVSDLAPGTSIGRFPLSVKVDRFEWTVFSPAQATPGAANPLPGVEIMLPLNGAVFEKPNFELSWYPAPGAAAYRVQVAADDSFSTFVLDEKVDAPQLAVELPSGTYFWRVQAQAENGTEAAFPPAQTVTVNPAFSSAHLAASRRQTNLSVPYISQHKDTKMLLLESQREDGEHAWDIPHPDLDRSDPADNTNCAEASIAMINAFLGGDLSQDRIGYEAFKDFWPGPEMDLPYGSGLSDEMAHDALAFALNAEPEYNPGPISADIMWDNIQFEIDAERPILASSPGHAFVITGYYDAGPVRYAMVNDPWLGVYAVDVTSVFWESYWRISEDSLPTFDPTINEDSDNDGVVDFDETERFGTDPNDPDKDKDDLTDQDDIRGSIFDQHFGYAIFGLSGGGRDYDGDGLPMEKDEDADGGGCFDGLEDFDLDGKFKEPETWNFDEGDDACFFGTNELVLDTTALYDDGSHHQRLRTYIKFSLQAVEGGKLEGLAQITYTHTGEFSSELCSGTHDIGTQVYEADLAGEFQKLPDGSTLVTFKSTPNHGPSYITDWTTNCPGEDQENEGWAWDGMGGTLKDGVYDLYTDFSSSLSGPGEFWQKVHMEQGAAQ